MLFFFLHTPPDDIVTRLNGIFFFKISKSALPSDNKIYRRYNVTQMFCQTYKYARLETCYIFFSSYFHFFSLSLSLFPPRRSIVSSCTPEDLTIMVIIIIQAVCNSDFVIFTRGKRSRYRITGNAHAFITHVRVLLL